jgi:hypothetical protein
VQHSKYVAIGNHRQSSTQSQMSDDDLLMRELGHFWAVQFDTSNTHVLQEQTHGPTWRVLGVDLCHHHRLLIPQLARVTTIESYGSYGKLNKHVGEQACW